MMATGETNKLTQHLQYSQIDLLKSKGLTAEEVIFNSCSKLRTKLQKIRLNDSETNILKKLRKRGREKWLHLRDCRKLDTDIETMTHTLNSLKNEKVALEEEIRHLKIKCFLADNTLDCCAPDECELLHDTTILIDDVLQCLLEFS